MRAMLGCLGCLGFIAAVVFVVSSIAMLIFAGDVSWGERTAMAGMISAIVVFAVVMLGWRDKAAFHKAKKTVARQLTQRGDVSDAEFCETFPQQDPRLILEVRNAIAAFYRVPPTKIHPTDNFNDDLAWRELSPSILCNVTFHILAAYEVPKPKPSNRVFGFPTSDRIDGFAEEMQQLMQKLRDFEADSNNE
jgi:hypothetical protein